MDVFGKPKRYFFQLLSHFATDPNHAEKLREFSTAKGQGDVYAYCHRVRRNVFEVLQDFHSVKKFPIEYLMDIFTEMRPRSFSIASCPKVKVSIPFYTDDRHVSTRRN